MTHRQHPRESLQLGLKKPCRPTADTARDNHVVPLKNHLRLPSRLGPPNDDTLPPRSGTRSEETVSEAIEAMERFEAAARATLGVGTAIGGIIADLESTAPS